MKKKLIIILSLILIIVGLSVIFLLQSIQIKPAGQDNRITKIEPGQNSIHRWPYLLYIPEKITNKYLLVIPNNTGNVDDKFNTHVKAAYSLINWQKEYADALGSALLVPIFPRPEYIGHVYTHALDRDVFLTDEEDIQRLDLQLISMVDDALSRLNKKGFDLNDKILLSGFSASGMFVNRFTLLHPDSVQAAAIGSPGGWPTVPVSFIDDEELIFPLGIADIEKLSGREFDLEEFRSVPQFFYIGSEDTNDASETAFYEGFELTPDRFGKTPAQRWPVAEEIFQAAGCNAQFIIYNGVGHEITDEMVEDSLNFLEQNSR